MEGAQFQSGYEKRCCGGGELGGVFVSEGYFLSPKDLRKHTAMDLDYWKLTRPRNEFCEFNVE